MTPNRVWFYEYEKLKGGDVLLGDNLSKKIVRRGKVRLIFKDGKKEQSKVCYIFLVSKEISFLSVK